MATSVLRLGQICSAAAASGELVAVATPEHRVTLLKRSGSGWQRLDEGSTLMEGHEATITALTFTGGATATDGANPPLRLASSSHDRNSYVWTQHTPPAEPPPATAPSSNSSTSGKAAAAAAALAAAATPGWRAELVITRLSKAGLCCAWAPCGRKYAIGSIDRMVDVVYLDAARQLWAPRLVKKRHEQAVMAVAWHPSGAVLATAAADGRLRLLNAVLPEVDGQPGLAALAGSRFGDSLLQLSLPGAWGIAAAFSPDGSCLAVASQGASGGHLTVLSGIDMQQPGSLDAAAIEEAAAAGEAAEVAAGVAAAGEAEADGAGQLQHLPLPGLPLKCLAFLSESLLVGGGFDCQPQLFVRCADGRWQYARSLHGMKPSSSQADAHKPQPAAASSSLAARIKMFEQQAAAAAATGSGGGSTSRAAGPSMSGAGAARAAVGGCGSMADGRAGSEQQHGPHENCIIAVCPLPPAAAASGSGSGASGDGNVLGFVSASLEGCIADWWVDPASL